ncbi:DUF808 family protein [Rhodobacterales bacterium HKCCE2091]|nr:DUF808 family protein [Rhodobacterales bacterium HKCCE2091]
MSGLLALLDDVAAIAKIAATSVDDVIGQASKAGAKAAGAVIDDAAVTPKYVHGFSAERELPIVWRITRGSIFNKIVILLPAAMLLSAFAPWAIYPLLMLGGLYLCFEGAEKIWHWISPAHHDVAEQTEKKKLTGAHLEEQKVKGAIKTDFILSAEIMTIALAALPTDVSIAFQAAALAIVGLGITAVVYGSVALIVKADDVGLHMAENGRLGATRAVGRGIVHGMPGFLAVLTTVGTAAMLWVGGSIVVHALAEIGWHLPEEIIHDIAVSVAHGLPENLHGAAEWIVTAAIDGVLGILIGLALIPIVTRVIAPAWRAVSGGKGDASAH